MKPATTQLAQQHAAVSLAPSATIFLNSRSHRTIFRSVDGLCIDFCGVYN